MNIDLHMHTTASDGAFSPSDVVELAHRLGLTTIAITDHDTTDGVVPAQVVAQAYGMTVLPGIELSAETNADGDVHTLGYCFDIEDHTLQHVLADFRTRRYNRGMAIVNRLEAMGLPLEWRAVEAIADGGAIGRPHVARAMIAAGYVSTVKEAFDRYLHNDGPAYVARKRLSPEEAIELIHGAGGVAVLAHPGLLPNPAAMITRMVKAGLDGIEINHPKNPPDVRALIAEMAARYGLITTGGSDFHAPEPDGSISLGTEAPPPGAVQALIR